MMTVSDALTTAWDTAIAEAENTPGYYHRRLHLQLSQPVYAGIVIPDRVRRLSFDFDKTSLEGVNIRDQTRGYIIDAEKQGTAERVFIHIQEAPGVVPKDCFRTLCIDVLKNLVPCKTSSEAVRTLYRRLQHWKRFFQTRPPEGLSREETVGLFGEVELFEKCLQWGLFPQLLSDAWHGPLGTNQDFLFGKIAIEVKAVVVNEAGSFRVSNLRQLDDRGLTHLYLSHTAYDFRSGSGRTLTSLVRSVRSMIAHASDALATFDDRILSAGYIDSDPSPFANHGFTQRQRSYFRIQDGFPRILESQLSAGISDVCYTVHLAACSACAIAEADVLNSIPR
jgi:hypothetical protein